MGPSVTPLAVSPEEDNGTHQHLAVYSNNKDAIQVTMTEKRKQLESSNQETKGMIATTTGDAGITRRLPRDMVSSLTASQEDFIEGEDLTKGRWGGGGGEQQDNGSPWKKVESLEPRIKSSLLTSIEASSNLEAISEIDELDPEALKERGAPRWCATKERPSSPSDSTPTRPERIKDSPIILPQRKESPMPTFYS